MSIPKIIWTYWEQGFDHAPPVVQACMTSWQNRNPGWELRVLDQVSSRDFTALHSMNCWNALPPEKRSNLLRLDLVTRYGGVWVDATLFCVNGLDNWLPSNPASGFVVFDLPKTANRYFSSYFLAAKPGNYFFSKWHHAHLSYMSKCPRPMRYSRKMAMMEKWPFLWSKVGSIAHTFSFFREQWGFPYFVLHYHANRLLLLNLRSRLQWLRRPRRTCRTFHTEPDLDIAQKQFLTESRTFAGTAWKFTRRHPIPEKTLESIISESKKSRP